mgnify:FL=1
MIKLALLGSGIEYTKSPTVHRAIGGAIGRDISFDVLDVPVERLDQTVCDALKSYDGLFVTKPYKNDIKRFLGDIKTACGVNFVRCADKTGYNTDGVGFIRALDKAFCDWRSRVDGALVLGAGGAAASVAEALGKEGKKVYILDRTAMNAARLTSSVSAALYTNQPAELIVNATSAGRHGEDILHALCVGTEFEFAFDLIYDPPETPFLRRLSGAGAKTSGGLDMLVYQAIAGDKILMGEFDEDEAYAAAATALNG